MAKSDGLIEGRPMIDWKRAIPLFIGLGIAAVILTIIIILK